MMLRGGPILLCAKPTKPEPVEIKIDLERIQPPVEVAAGEFGLI